MNRRTRHSSSAGGALGAVLFILAVLPQPAHAYLDANTGSMVLQALMAGAGGILMLIKMHWKRRFARKPRAQPKK